MKQTNAYARTLAAIRLMARSGASRADASAALQISWRAVDAIAKQNGIVFGAVVAGFAPGRVITLRVRLIAGKASGESISQLPSPPIWDWKERDAELLALREAGLSTIRIAEILGCSKNAVIGRLTRLGYGVPRQGPQPRPVYAYEALDADGCRWPLGHPGDDGFHFCGARQLAGAGRPYCPDHLLRSVEKVKKGAPRNDAA